MQCPVLMLHLNVFTLKGMEEQMSQLEDGEAKEAEWRRLKPYLHCGKSKMKLKATGLRAADITLDVGIVSQPDLYTISLLNQ